MDSQPNLCDLADTHLHRYHAEILARRRIAITARSHFDRQIAALTTTEEAIRAEFDRRFFADHPDERRLPSDDAPAIFIPQASQATA